VRNVRTGFTTRASCLLAAGGTALLCGLLLGVVDLVRAGLLALAVPIASAVVVYRSRVRIANRRGLDPARVEAGNAVTVTLSVTNRAMLRTGALLLEDQLPQQVSGTARFVVPGLAGREVRTVSYRMPALRRGRYRVGPLRIRLTDPFHMIDVVRSFATTSEFIVTPVVERLPAIEPPRSYDIGDNAGSHSVGAHGADDASTREYRTGDDLRKIHWRSTARTGALMVRLEERPWQGRSTMLLDLRGAAHVTGVPIPAHEDARAHDSLEWSVSAAASIGTHLMLAGRQVGLVDDAGGDTRVHFDNAARLSDQLATVAASPRTDLAQVAAVLRASARDSAVVAIVGRLDAVSLRTLAEAHPRGSSVPAFALLLDIDTWRFPDRAARDDTDVAAAARVLRGSGWRVAIVRREHTVSAAWDELLHSPTDGASAVMTGTLR
jgi:uncharacterized protein (DUF58 family)